MKIVVGPSGMSKTTAQELSELLAKMGPQIDETANAFKTLGRAMASAQYKMNLRSRRQFVQPPNLTNVPRIMRKTQVALAVKILMDSYVQNNP
jgi:hypothetical protein